MNDPDLMQFITDLCDARRIGTLGLSTLKAWHAVLVFGSETDATRRAALLLATVLDPDAAEVNRRLGPDVARIVAELAPRDRWSDLANRVANWCRHARRDDPVGVAAIGLLAAEVATTSSNAEADTIDGFLGILAADGEAAEQRRTAARILRKRIARSASTTTSSETKRSMVSVSIDMAGSTEAKTRMLALAGDGARLHELYGLLYSEFLRHEHRFYSALFDQSNGWHGPALDWRRLFVVKGIGDELWLLYELDPNLDEDRRSAPVRLLSASLALAQESIGWHGTEHSSDPAATPDEEAQQRFHRMDLAYKVHLDLIADALEISSMRADAVASNVGAYLGRSAARFDADAAELAGRLNAGQFNIAGRRLNRVFRTDYIGHEVDRFFRTTKFSLPGVVTVGQALYNAMQAQVQLIAYPGLFQAHFQYERDPARPGIRGGWSEPLFSSQEVSSADLKGIGYPYRVHHFVTRQQLNYLWRHVPENALLAPVLRQFPLELKEQLMTVAEAERARRN